MDLQDRGELLTEVSGKPVSGAYPSMFGNTRLRIFERRIVETTKRIIFRRRAEILPADVDSVEMTTLGNPVWLVLGILTLALFGLGIVFIVLYFFTKNRFLIVRSRSNVMAVTIEGDEKPYRVFMETVLAVAEAAKKDRT
jgi:hypothetical protein